MKIHTRLNYSQLAEQFPHPWWTTFWRIALSFCSLWFRLFQRPRGAPEFTNDWATFHFPNWEYVLKSLAGKPRLRYLEVGAFEGRSLLWMFENILTHPTSRAVAVDVFGPDYAFRFLRNLVMSGKAWSTKLLPGYSADVLRNLKRESFDLIYLDGSHSMASVMIDLSLSWDLIKPGGIVIVDDYRIGQDTLPKDLTPTISVDTFLLGFGKYIEVLHRDHQVIFRKVGTAISGELLFPFGNAYYDWYRKTLTVGPGSRQPLTSEECELLDQYIRLLETSYPTSQATPPVPQEITNLLERYGAQI